MLKTKTWQDCYVRTDGDRLWVGNDLIERSWTFVSGRPVNVSLLDKTHQEEWLKSNQQSPTFEFPWLPASAQPSHIKVSAFHDNDQGISKPYLQTDVDMDFPTISVSIRFTIKVYPLASFIRQEVTVLSLDTARSTVTGTEGSDSFIAYLATEDKEQAEQTHVAFQLDDNNKEQAAPRNDYSERLELKDLHCRWESISFRDQTDTNNNLVSRDNGLLYVNENRSLQGNILFLRKTLQKHGLLLIKEGPTPLGQLQELGADFQFRGLNLTIHGTGIEITDMASNAEITSYGTTVGVYDGDMYSGYQLLHAYHRNIHDHNPKRDSFMMSNTWGDRSKDSAVNETFLIKELEVAAQLGLSIVQIDDGWQSGVTSNSVDAPTVGGRWSDYYSGDGDFWSVHPERFKNGLTPVIEHANKLGIKIGLWYSPDSAHVFTNYQKDVEKLLQLHSDYGVAAFKLDGIDIRSKLGESRLISMMQQVIKATEGQLDFNIDTTAQKRLGFFGRTQYGSIFLENRYTDWNNYYPHWTLRNLWTIAPYVPATKLQMEFLNVNRNKEKYVNDPLAPAASGQVYAFAVVAFTNPLAWMELSSLDEAQVANLSAIIHAIKPYHKDILAGQVMPIGQEPSGVSWTGLQSITSPTSGYILVMREWNDESSFAMKLWGIPAGASLRLTELVRMDEKDVVLAQTEATVTLLASENNGKYVFNRPAPFTFAIFRYELLP